MHAVPMEESSNQNDRQLRLTATGQLSAEITETKPKNAFQALMISRRGKRKHPISCFSHSVLCLSHNNLQLFSYIYLVMWKSFQSEQTLKFGVW